MMAAFKPINDIHSLEGSFDRCSLTIYCSALRKIHVLNIIIVYLSIISEIAFATDRYWMSLLPFFTGAHFLFYFSSTCTYSIRCVFFDIFNFPSIVWFHFNWHSYFFLFTVEWIHPHTLTINREGREKRKKASRKMAEKRAMHEVRVMCNGHKNSVRTNTWATGSVFFTSFFFLYMSFRFLIAFYILLVWLAFSASSNVLWCEVSWMQDAFTSCPFSRR